MHSAEANQQTARVRKKTPASTRGIAPIAAFA